MNISNSCPQITKKNIVKFHKKSSLSRSQFPNPRYTLLTKNQNLIRTKATWYATGSRVPATSCRGFFAGNHVVRWPARQKKLPMTKKSEKNRQEWPFLPWTDNVRQKIISNKIILFTSVTHLLT